MPNTSKNIYTVTVTRFSPPCLYKTVADKRKYEANKLPNTKTGPITQTIKGYTFKVTMTFKFVGKAKKDEAVKALHAEAPDAKIKVLKSKE